MKRIKTKKKNKDELVDKKQNHTVKLFVIIFV